MNKHYPKNHKPSEYRLGAFPTTERCRHMGGFRRTFIKADDASGAVVQRYRARWASPLDLYRDKQIINRAQFLAGLRFGRIYQYAVSSKTAYSDRASRIDSPSPRNTSDSLLRALAYVEQAHASLSSETMSVVIDVCAHARPVTTPEALNQLRKGLGCLAREWGIAVAETCQNRKS